jgi:hypothetical protein
MACLGTQADDMRLGDLSEQYVRTHEGVSAFLGTAPLAMAASHFAADLRYLLATANVMLFARAVDPGLRLAEDGAAAFIALDLRERTMAMLRIAAHKLVLPALLLVCSAVLIKSAVDVWQTWQQTETLMAQLQREKAEAAAQRIESFVQTIVGQIGWVAQRQWAALPVEQRRFDYVRLLRQVPAITELGQLDGEGREQLKVSRLFMDVVGSEVDRSAEPAFIQATAIQATANRVYWGPVYYRKASEPYMTVAVLHGGRTGVTLAETNLKFVWDVIKAVKVGETGYGYIVDGSGRLIAHQDTALVLRGTNLSALPQVALKGPPSEEPIEGKTFGASGPAATVSSVHTVIPSLEWRVFVDLPAAETQASLWNAVIRGGSLLGLGLMTALLAIFAAARPVTPARPAAA